MTAQSAEISVPYLEERLKSKPRSRAFSRLADAYRRRGDLRQAIDLCTEGLAQHPNYLTARLVLGRCYLAQKNYSAAAGELKKVCMADRRNHAALMMLAESYLQQGEEEKAGGIYQILLKMEPYNPWIEQLATRYKSLGDKDLFEILEISSPNLDSSLQNLKSSGVDDLTDIQNLDTIQSDPPPAQSTEGDEPTSQDVEERLDLLFEEKAAQPPESPTQAQNEFELSESPNTPEPSDSDVSGSDVSSRLDELFGDEKNEDSDPFSLNSAETIQMNRDDLIQNTSDVDLPAPESEIEAETSGDQLLDFDAGETIQMDRVQLGEAMEKEESPQPADSNQPESDLTEKTIAWDNDNDEIKAAEDSEEGYEDGIDTPEQINQEPSPSGEDIIETLDNLFGKETASDSEKGPETSAPEESESDQDKEVTASDIEKRLQELFPEDEEKKEVSSSQESGTINHSEIVEVEDFTKPEEEVMDQVEDINSELSDLPNTESKNITETEEKINDENVTGADVEKQLDQLFPEESNLGEASHEEPAFDDQTSDDENVSKADIEEKPDQTTPQENADKPESISQIEQDDVFETIELKDESPKEQTVGSDESVSGADIEEKLDQIFPKE
ncbi:MAG: tetratricopeptide repeat protein, partial [Chitinispirillaceae bacterium]